MKSENKQALDNFDNKGSLISQIHKQMFFYSQRNFTQFLIFTQKKYIFTILNTLKKSQKHLPNFDAAFIRHELF